MNTILYSAVALLIITSTPLEFKIPGIEYNIADTECLNVHIVSMIFKTQVY